MADIRSYLKEKEKREKGQSDYRSKIRRHRLTFFYRIALAVIVAVAVAALLMVQYKNHVYTDYDIVSTVSREKAAGAKDVRLQNAILTYSKDGAHCTNTKGEIIWNQTYEIQDVQLEVCGNVAAIGNYNGRNIYIADSSALKDEINTAMPLRDLAVAADGTVTAVLADTDVTWIYTYTADGVYEGMTHMDDSGYPGAVSLSPNGDLLAVAYVYLDSGMLKTNVVFYNFGLVGSNYSDYLVGVFSYPDLLVPTVHFMNDDTAFAVGDSRLMIYKGSQKPTVEKEYLFEEEIQSVFYGDSYLGLVFSSELADKRYRLDIYSESAEKIDSYYFDMEYNEIFFEEKNFVIYNETECVIRTYDGVEKFNGTFRKATNLMLPAGGPYRYALVTDTSIDTIQLK